MGTAESELEAVVSAPRYRPLAAYAQLADALADTHRARNSVAAEPGWQGTSADAAAAQFRRQGSRALGNGDRVQGIATAIERANSCIDEANDAYRALPEASLGGSVLATVLGGGSVNLGRFGIATTVVGLVLAQRRMEADREAAAATALRTLRQQLDGIALEISRLDQALEAPNALMHAAVPVGLAGGAPDEFGYSLGKPNRPDIEWDEDFEYDSKDPEFGDYAAAAKWKAKSAAARALRWDLGDALDVYGHYWSNTGDPFTIDLDRAYTDDTSIASNIDSAIHSAQQSADGYAAGGHTNFSITGAAGAAGSYPTTENWQKTIGAYQQWTSADVQISGTQATMEVTVHAEDYYNFNRGQADIASNAPDDENGRFTEIGWARPFETSGAYTRTVTWTVGDPGSATISEPEGR